MGSTTVHIPDPLLSAIDARARADGVSRNRYIIQALERTLREEESWSPELLAELRKPPCPGDARVLDRLVKDVRANRRSKKAPPEL